MLKHLEEDHGANTLKSQLRFPSMDDFYQWKEREESTNFVYFSVQGGASTSQYAKNHYFVCQHNGPDRPHRKKTEPARLTNRTNKKGSIKTGLTCPARMLVKQNFADDSVDVTYIRTHSHDISFNNTEHHPMPKSIRDELEGKIALGIPLNQIMRELRDGTGVRENHETAAVSQLRVRQFVKKRAIAEMYRRMNKSSGQQSGESPSFHNRLSTFVKKKSKKGIDGLVTLLLEMEQEDPQRRQEDVLSQATSQLVGDDVSCVPRHKRGIAIPDRHIEPDPDQWNKWRIKSQSTDSVHYTITVLDEVCSQDHCFTKCSELPCIGLCPHLYSCDCEDSDPLCKHVHRLHSFLTRTRLKEIQPALLVANTEDDDDDDNHSEFPHWVSTSEPVKDDSQLPSLISNSDPVKDNSKSSNQVSNSDPTNKDSTNPEENTTLLESTKADLAKLSKLLDNPDVRRSLLPQISGTLQSLLGQCSSTMKSKNSSKQPHEFSGILPTTASNSKVVVRLVKKSLKRKASEVPFENRSADQNVKLHESEVLLSPSQVPVVESECEVQSAVINITNPLENPSSAPSPSLTTKTASRLAQPQETTTKNTDLVSKKAKPAVQRSDSTSHSPGLFTPAISNTFSPDDIIVKNGPHSLTLINLKSLEPSLSVRELKTLRSFHKDFQKGQLHDEVINSYFWCMTQDNAAAIMYAPSSILPAMMEGSAFRLLWGGYEIERVEYIFIPWNPSGHHWVLWTVDVKRNVLMYLDPLRNDQDTASYPDYVRDARVKISTILEVKFNMADLTLEFPDKSLQRDSTCCGVMVCYYGNQIISKKSLTDIPNIVNFRKKIYRTLVGKCRPQSKQKQEKCPLCDGESDNFIQCNRCHQCYHCKCVGFIKKGAEAVEVFYCP